MARLSMRYVIQNQHGIVVQNALVRVFLTGTTTPVVNMWDQAVGGVNLSALLSDVNGVVVGWFDAPTSVDLSVTDNGNTAHQFDNTTPLGWAAYTVPAVDIGGVGAIDVANEVTRATTAEATNTTAITVETSRAIAAEATKATASSVTTEATTARTAEATNAAAVVTETTRATTAEATKATSAALTAEATTARAAEGTNATGITTETTRATAAEGANATAIATKAALLAVAATVTAAGALVVNKHNPVDATAGPLTMTLPTGQPQGSIIIAEKYDSTTNAVTVSGNIRGVPASTDTLVLPHQTTMFEADAAGSWWPVSSHKPLATLVRQAGQQAIDFGVPATLAPSGAMFEAVYETYGNVAPFVQCIGGSNVYNGQQDDVFYFAEYNRSNGGGKKVSGVPSFGHHIEGHVFDNGDDRAGNNHAFEWNFDYNYPVDASGGLRLLAFRCDRSDPKVYTRWSFSLSEPGSLGRFDVHTYAGIDLMNLDANGNLTLRGGLTAGGQIRNGFGGVGLSLGSSTDLQVDVAGTAGGRFQVDSAKVLTGLPIWIGTPGTQPVTPDVSLSRSALSTLNIACGSAGLSLGNFSGGIDMNSTGGFRLYSATGSIIMRSNIGFYGHAAVAQPAAPVTLADVIAVIRGCGLSA